jgi:2-methylisocitrate lyase-like PEP mutase family enzyme
MPASLRGALSSGPMIIAPGAYDGLTAALAAGADAAFVEAPQTEAEIASVPAAVNGPCLFNVVPGGRSPAVSLAGLESLGYRIVIFPAALLGAVIAACDQVLAGLAAACADTACPRKLCNSRSSI